MPLLIILIGLLVFGAILLPQFWVKRTIKKHGGERRDFPGTGGELAQHLVAEAGLNDVRVIRGPEGADYYDPEAKLISLSPDHFDGKSISAVAIAAHEFGHALQDHEADKLLRLRTLLGRFLPPFERAALVMLTFAPVVAVFAKSPLLFAAQIGFAVLLMSGRVLMHAITLPTEFDASFKRALPILQRGGYLSNDDLPAASSVLRAAALTYVAAALMTLLNIARWFRMLR
jgi:Zn-dependent membrane protease YugP